MLKWITVSLDIGAIAWVFMVVLCVHFGTHRELELWKTIRKLNAKSPTGPYDFHYRLKKAANNPWMSQARPHVYKGGWHRPQAPDGPLMHVGEQMTLADGTPAPGPVCASFRITDKPELLNDPSKVNLAYVHVTDEAVSKYKVENLEPAVRSIQGDVINYIILAFVFFDVAIWDIYGCWLMWKASYQGCATQAPRVYWALAVQVLAYYILLALVTIALCYYCFGMCCFAMGSGVSAGFSAIASEIDAQANGGDDEEPMFSDAGMGGAEARRDR